MKKIAFVAHEFGIYPGHGGIASYLYQLCSLILETHEEYQVDVLALQYDRNCDLLKNSRFRIHKILPGSLQKQGEHTLKLLKQIRPDYVEIAEYLALGLESILYRDTVGGELKNTIFITDNHTASRECFEWSTKLPLKLAPYSIQEAFCREQLQMHLSDLNVAPSDFLAHYVQKNYSLPEVRTVRHPVKVETCSKEENLRKVSAEYDISDYAGQFVISCITRVEGRKNQKGLISAFISFVEETGASAVLILVGNSSISNITGREEKFDVFEAVPTQYREMVQFFDFMDNKGKKQILAISDVAVLASPFENFPVAMTECVCQGVPVLASIYSGCYDFMDGVRDVTAFDPFQEDDLKDKIKKLYLLKTDGLKKVAQIQYQNLTELVSTKNSVDYKLSTYSRLPNKASNNKERIFNNLFWVDKSNIHQLVTSEMVGKNVTLILKSEKYEKAVIENYLQNYSLFSGLHPESVIVCGNQNFDYEVVGALINHKVIMLNNFTYRSDDVGKQLVEIITDRLILRRPYYYFPILEEAKRDKNESKNELETEDIYKILINQQFFKKNSQKLEDFI